MQIGIKNQFTMEVEGLKSDEVGDLSITEEVGLSLPVFQLHIQTRDKKAIADFTTPGKILKIGIGKTQIDEQMEIQIAKRNIPMGASGGDMFDGILMGLLYKDGYLTKQRRETFESSSKKQSSDEVWSKIFKKYNFKIETVKFNDKMLWLQPNISDRKFLETIIWHGFYKDNDCPLSTLTRNNRAVWKPFSELKKIKGVISNTDSGDYKANRVEPLSNEGFMSNIGGGKRILPARDLDQGADYDVRAKAQQNILGKGIIEDIIKVPTSHYMNDNVHKKYFEAMEQRKIFTAALSSVSLEFHFDSFQPLYPLDYVKVLWKQQHTNELVDSIGGEWLVANSNIFFSGQAFQQRVKVHRETIK